MLRTTRCLLSPPSLLLLLVYSSRLLSAYWFHQQYRVARLTAVQALDLERMSSMQILMASSHRQVLREDDATVKSSKRSHRAQSTASRRSSRRHQSRVTSASRRSSIAADDTGCRFTLSQFKLESIHTAQTSAILSSTQ